MGFHDDFFQELLHLTPIIKSLQLAMREDLPEESLLALESACARLSTRALEIIEGVVTDAQEARPAQETKSCGTPTISAQSSISSPSTTDPANTSSQPAPVDLANCEEKPKLGA